VWTCEYYEQPKQKHYPRGLKKWMGKVYQTGFIEVGPYTTMNDANGYIIKRKQRCKYLLKYEDAIRFMLEQGGMCDGIILDYELRLAFTWEDDNGLYCTNGSTPFEFEQVGLHWMFEELTGILEVIGMNISDYSNEEELLIGVTRNLKSGKICLKQKK
jgi:hypothetical protein